MVIVYDKATQEGKCKINFKWNQDFKNLIQGSMLYWLQSAETFFTSAL